MRGLSTARRTVKLSVASVEMTSFFVLGEEGIPQGLKPRFVGAPNARAKARAYLRDNGKGKNNNRSNSKGKNNNRSNSKGKGNRKDEMRGSFAALKDDESFWRGERKTDNSKGNRRSFDFGCAVAQDDTFRWWVEIVEWVDSGCGLGWWGLGWGVG